MKDKWWARTILQKAGVLLLSSPGPVMFCCTVINLPSCVVCQNEDMFEHWFHIAPQETLGPSKDSWTELTSRSHTSMVYLSLFGAIRVVALIRRGLTRF